MNSRSLLTLVVVISSAQFASAQQWAEKMFEVRSHDFGTVARAAKAEFAFPVKNLFGSDIHISGVRASCGCTTPIITQATIKPGETGSIVSRFNTRTFLGQRRATITVSIDRPQYAQVQLQIKGYVRRDVVIHPGMVKFGTVGQGQTAEQKVAIEYAGRSDWKIVDIQAPAEHYEWELKETRRSSGRVGYELAVRLEKDAPTGYLQDELILVTNDHREASRHVPLVVQGRVAPELSISPASLFLGEIAPGGEVMKRIIVRGHEPFKIVSVDFGAGPFKLEFGEESKKLHLVSVRFSADKPGEYEQPIRVVTDLPGKAAAGCKAYATVALPEDQ